MNSQILKAGLITTSIILAIAAVFVYIWVFFDVKNNQPVVVDSIGQNIEKVKGGDKDAKKIESEDAEFKPEVNVLDEDVDNGEDVTSDINDEKTVPQLANAMVKTTANNESLQEISSLGVIFDTISFFDDVNTKNTNTGDVLAWNGNQWVPATSGQNTDNQFLAINGNILTIADGNSVELPELKVIEYTAGDGLNLKDEKFEISAPTCNTTQVLTWDGNEFDCVQTEGAVYTAGDAITINNNEIAVVAPTCVGTDKLSWNGSNFICSSDSDTLQTLSCANGQIAQYNGTNWICATNISGTTTFLGLTDTPGSYSANQLLRVNATGTALEYYDDSVYYDNTDNQNLTSATLLGNVLTIAIEDGNPVNVDLTNLINDADFNPTNEIQDLNLVGDDLTITNNSGATTIDLSPYLDNTDNQQIDTFNLSANVLTLEMQRDGQVAQTVNLAGYLDNTDAQAISRTGETISITGSTSTVDLTPYINTDNQTLALNTNTLSISGGNNVSLAGYLDNTDNQNLSIVGHTISLTNGGDVVVPDNDTTYTAGTGLNLSSTAFNLANTTVVSGSYTNSNITVDAQGRITSASNGTDNNTTYTSGGTLLNLTGTTFSLNEGILTNNRLCTYVTGTGLVCNTIDNSTNWNTAYGWGDHSAQGYLTDAPVDGNTYGRNNGIWTLTDISAGLEKIDEGSGYGWRLIGKNPVNYGIIGGEAVDLSEGGGATMGATGYASLASGYYTTALGFASTAQGRETEASGSNSHAEGLRTTASGSNSYAGGSNTIASGNQSYAIGDGTTASGDRSYAEGYSSIASGMASHAEGYATRAINDYSHVAGRYNIGTSTETIHETGIGPSGGSRMNAFEIYTDGSVLAPEFSITEINSRGNTSLVTKEYVDLVAGGSTTTFLGLTDTLSTYLNGSILFTTGTGVTDNNTQFSWDNVNNRLGIGTNTPSSKLSIFGADNGMRLSYDASNYADLSVSSSGELLINATSATESAMVIGSGVAQDTSIQFDGNTHDFFSGIDDATGSYVIGSGFNVSSSAVEAGPGTVSNSAGGTTVTGTNTKFTATFRVGNQITIGSDTVTILSIVSDTSMTTGTIANANTNATYTYNAGTAVTVEPSGNLGIGTDNPSYALDVKATGASTVIARFNNDSTNTSCTLTANGGTLNCSSDERLKKNIATVQDGLETLMKLNPKTYNWKTESNEILPTYGFIAQEVKEILPQLVRTDEETGYLQLSTIGMIPVITQAVQDQNALIETNINDLSLKASATTVVGLQKLVDSELVATSGILNQVQNDIGQMQDDIMINNEIILATQKLANTNANLLSDVKDRMTNIELTHTELMDFFTLINPDTLVYTDGDGDLTIEGMINAGNISVESIVITGKKESAIIGEGEIVVDAIDVFVPTTAVKENSRIFVTPKGGVVTQTMSISKIDENSGFHVTVAEPVTEVLKFDWFIVKDEVNKVEKAEKK